MFFPIYRFTAPRIQLALVTALSLTGLISYQACPNQLSLFLMYFILWWAGAELARTTIAGKIPSFRTQASTLVILAGMVALMAGPVAWAFRQHIPLRPGLHPVLELRHFASCLCLLCGGLIWSKWRWRGFNHVFGWFLPVAPVSYALYVLHFPVCNGAFWAMIAPAWLQIPAAVAVTFSVVCGAELIYQRKIVGALDWLGRRLTKSKHRITGEISGA